MDKLAEFDLSFQAHRYFQIYFAKQQHSQIFTNLEFCFLDHSKYFITSHEWIKFIIQISYTSHCHFSPPFVHLSNADLLLFWLFFSEHQLDSYLLYLNFLSFSSTFYFQLQFCFCCEQHFNSVEISIANQFYEEVIDWFLSMTVTELMPYLLKEYNFHSFYR